MDFINKYFATARSYWLLRTTREKLFVLTAISLIVCAMIYNIVWLPMQKSIVSLRVVVPLHTNQLAQMKSQAQHFSSTPIISNRATAANLLSVIEKSLDTHGLREYMTKMELDRKGGAKLSMENTGYNKLLKWILNLERQFGVEVKSARIHTAKQPGEVNSDIIFVARPG